MICSMHTACGVLCTVSVWRGVYGYLNILVVVIVNINICAGDSPVVVCGVMR